MDWFTADLHLGHKNVIAHSNRPFSSVEEMDSTLIANWNKRVCLTDTIYVVGDFTLGADHDKYLSQLKGDKILILGNHDQESVARHSLGWKAVYKMLELRYNKQTIVLCHYAMRVWNKSHYGSLHLYGHSHGKIAPTAYSCDVGVDCWNYQPITLNEAIALMRMVGTAG